MSHKRSDIEAHIQQFLDSPSKYNTSNSFGSKKYLKQLKIDEETGELSKANFKLRYNRDGSLMAIIV